MTSQNQLQTIQKTSFSTMNEFIEWVKLVDELADHHLKEVAVTYETWSMLVREWQSIRGYSWAKFTIYKDYVEQGNNLKFRLDSKRSIKVVLDEGVTT